MIDIPQSLINAYVKKVKDTTGKNLRQFLVMLTSLKKL